MNRWSPILMVAAIGLGFPAFAEDSTPFPELMGACPSPEQVSRALVLLSEERLEQAEPLLLPFEDTCAGVSTYLLALGRAHFQRGRYTDAREVLDHALLLEPEPAIRGIIAYQRGLASRTAELVSGFEIYRDPAGRFEVRYPPGKDAVLIPHIREAFPKIRERIGGILGYHPGHPVRIEIYGAPGDLAKASSLTADEIEASGTIALCKYHKMMLVSPRALVHGYTWIDTLSHEYVHYAIQRLTGMEVPIWLHEAFAKYLESRWRGEKSAPMRPSAQHLLREALRKRNLVTFEQMSPSMAKLPTRERTSLAFAEVYTVAQYLDDKVGPAGIRRLLSLMGAGRTDREALSEVLGMGFRRFTRTWKRYVRARKWSSVPAGVLDLLVFRDRDDPRSELRRIGQKAAEDFTYLGDLLKARKRVKASIVEYRKAEARTRGLNPIVQYKLADALLREGQAKAAWDAVQGPLPYYPEHVLLQLNRARAAAKLGRLDAAAQALQHALRLNPFDVEIHVLYADVAQRRGEKVIEARERRAVELLAR